MPFRPESPDPNFAQLKTILNKGRIKQNDTPTYQVIDRLLDQLMQFRNNVNGRVTSLQEEVDEISSGGGGSGSDVSDASFLTIDNEQADLPNSKRLLAGDGVTFDDTATDRTVNADLPVGTVFSTYINVNPGALLGYGVWNLMATGIKSPVADITFTVY